MLLGLWLYLTSCEMLEIHSSDQCQWGESSGLLSDKTVEWKTYLDLMQDKCCSRWCINIFIIIVIIINLFICFQV